MQAPIPADTTLLTISQAADFLGVSIDTLRRWDKAGKVHAIRADGKNRFFYRSEIETLKKQPALSVSQAASALGISASTLRRYEKKGLVIPNRSDTHYRVYTGKMLEELRRVRRAVELSHAPLARASEYVRDVMSVWQKASVGKVSPVLIGAALLLVIVGGATRWYEYASTMPANVLGETTQSWGGIISQMVSRIRNLGRLTILPIQRFTDITYFSRDAAGNIVPKYPLVIPTSDFLKLQYALTTPTALPGNIAVLSEGGLIPGLRITSENIVAGTVAGGIGGLIRDASIIAADLSDGAITSAKIADGTIATIDIADDAITADKLAAGVGGTPTDDSVTSSKIVTDTINATDLAETLTFGSSDFLNLSAITHATTARQGLQLPNASSASPSNPTSGEGYIAWDAAGNQVVVYNGSSWAEIGGSVTLAASGGLAYVADELTLLATCDSGQLLKWNGSAWACGNDTGGGGGGITTVEKGNANVVASSVSLDFSSDFGVALDAGEGENEADISIDYTTSKITRTDQTQSITGGWTFSNLTVSDTDITLSGATTTFTGTGAMTLVSGGTGDLTLNAASGAVKIAAGDSVGNATWSIASNGLATGLSANDLTGCTDCIGADEIAESGISSTNLSDGSNIAHINAAETISGGWTFNTAATTFTTAVTANGGITTGAGTGLTVASGNNGAGAAGNISVDVGTSTVGNGSILIGTAARTQTITIGNSTGGTITIGQSSGSDLVLQDAQWSVSGVGAASFASVSEGGTALASKYAPIGANFVTVTTNATLTGETGIDALSTAISTTNTLNVDSTATLNAVTLDANANLTLSSGTGSVIVTNSVSNASDQVIDIAPAFAGGATDLLTYTVIDVAAFSPTNATGTDTVNAIEVGALTDPGATITSTALKIGAGWDTGISVAAGGITITAGALAVNSDSITSDGTLTIDANARVSIATGDFLSTSVAGVTGAAAGDIWYDSSAGKYKINEGGSTKVLCNTTDLGCGTGGGGGIATVEANNVDAVTTAVSLDFLGADFDVSLDTGEGSNEADVAIDYTNSGITRKGQAETISGGWIFTPTTTTDITFNGDADSNVQFAGTLTSDDTSVNSVDISTVINAVAGAAVVYGVNIAQADNTTNAAVVDAILRVQNANAAETTADGLLIEQTGAGTLTAALEIKESAGTITDGILITGTLANILNSASIDITGAGAITGATGVSTTTVTASNAIAANGGITFDAATDTLGAFTAAGTIDMNSNILTKIGNTGTNFIATTGALTLAGDLTLSNNTLVCTACIDVTDMAANAVDDSELVDALTYTGAMTLTPGTTLDVTVNMDADSTFALVFSSGTTATNGITYSVTNSASSGTVAVVGQDITLVGTANAAGANTITGIKFENVTAQTNNTFNGVTFGTGFTNFLTSGTINISAAGVITGATGVSTTTVTASSAIAANWGITFDASTDTIGAHTAGGTYNMSGNIITNIGATSSSFTTSGALELVLDAAATNGVLNVDNAAQASSIFVAEDNGTPVFTIADGGDITWAAATPAITINDNEVLTIADAATADTFTINTSGSLFSFSDGTNSYTFDVDVGPVYAGAARPTKKITLTPEYPGGAIMADGSNNTGTMTSDNTNAGATKYRNFYKWANTQGTAQDYDIWVSVPIPNDFSAMAATPTLSIDTYTSDLTNGTVLVTVYDTQSTPVADCTDTAFTPTGAINTWETKTATTCLDTGTYTAGGVMTIKIHLTGAATSGVTQVSTITFDYMAKF